MKRADRELLTTVLGALTRAPASQASDEVRTTAQAALTWLDQGGSLARAWDVVVAISTRSDVTEFVRKLCELQTHYLPPEVHDHSVNVAPVMSCNLHRDCAAADARVKAGGMNVAHCRDEFCEDCFGC